MRKTRRCYGACCRNRLNFISLRGQDISRSCLHAPLSFDGLGFARKQALLTVPLSIANSTNPLSTFISATYEPLPRAQTFAGTITAMSDARTKPATYRIAPTLDLRVADQAELARDSRDKD